MLKANYKGYSYNLENIDVLHNEKRNEIVVYYADYGVLLFRIPLDDVEWVADADFDLKDTEAWKAHMLNDEAHVYNMHFSIMQKIHMMNEGLLEKFSQIVEDDFVERNKFTLYEKNNS
jgi:hypothetical protein